jgi:hypothetical protein
MAKFYGEIGFNEGTVEEPADSGVFIDVIIERSYFGDVVRDSLRFREGDKINNDLTVSNSISIVADAYANEHIFAMRYIKWQGVLWVVSNVDVKHPRLEIRLGGVYNGQPAGTP